MSAQPEIQTNYYITVGLPILTLVLGYVGSLITEWWRDSRQEKRDNQKREHEKTQQAEDRRASFQRETLLELSSLLLAFDETIRKIMYRYRKYGPGQLPMESELGEEFMNLMSKITAYRERVLDEELRSAIKKIQQHGTEILFAKDENQLKKGQDPIGAAFFKANERLGILLRDLY